MEEAQGLCPPRLSTILRRLTTSTYIIRAHLFLPYLSPYHRLSAGHIRLICVREKPLLSKFLLVMVLSTTQCNCYTGRLPRRILMYLNSGNLHGKYCCNANITGKSIKFTIQLHKKLYYSMHNFNDKF